MRHLWKQNKLAQFVDPRLQTYDLDEVMRTINVGILCTSRAAADRPPMSAVVSMLEGFLTLEVETQAQMAILSDEEQAPDLLRMITEIDEDFESEEITETLERYPVSTKGKEKVSCDSFSIEAESSRAGAEREGFIFH